MCYTTKRMLLRCNMRCNVAVHGQGQSVPLMPPRDPQPPPAPPESLWVSYGSISEVGAGYLSKLEGNVATPRARTRLSLFVFLHCTSLRAVRRLLSVGVC